MEIDITIKNYRCFEDTLPLRVEIGRRFVAFVGPNNAGKSSVLRWFYEFRQLLALLSRPTGNLAAALSGSPQSINFTDVTDHATIFCDKNDRDLSFEMRLDPTATPKPGQPRAAKGFSVVIGRTSGWTASVESDAGWTKGNTPLALSGEILSTPQGDKVADLEPYFRAFKLLASTLYIGAFRNILNVDPKSRYLDIEVARQFVSTWREFKTGPNKTQNEVTLRLSKELGGLFGIKELEINPSSDGSTLQVFVDGKSYRLEEVGAGLAQFIIVLANAATRRPAFILIDEPELNLHATLQLGFLAALGANATEGVLFSTHSLGLARAGAETVYSVRRRVDGASEVTLLDALRSFPEFLGELSFGGYHALGFDKVLLVEGVTEVKAMQQLLRLYGKDQRVLLLPLGGSAMINGKVGQELSEVLRVTTNVSAVIDSERATAGATLATDRQAFSALCATLGIGCKVLDRRAIENYFTDRAVKAAFGPQYAGLGGFDLVKNAPRPWGKSDNWRIARQMELSETNATDLGSFLGAL